MSSTRQLAEQRARIIRLAEKRAFENYLRRGHPPNASAHMSEAARELSLKALGEARPTTHYTWRTARDDRVRPAHAANEGRVFAWSDPPATGHPGQGSNCRCRTEPYYGTPFVSDTTLPLRHGQRFDAMGKAIWRSIETLTRPDGSLAESLIFMRDGTRIRSTFTGAQGAHELLLPDGRRVRVERQNGIQALYVDDSRRPLLRSVWTADGPRIAAPRQRVADLLGLPRRSVPSGQFDEIVLFDPSRLSLPDPELALGSAAVLALLALYGMTQAEPAAVGAGSGDVAAVAFRVWKGDAKDPTVVSLAALTAEAVAQSCKRMPEVQAWTNEAARSVGPLSGSPQARGTAIHKQVEARIKALKDLLPPAYADILQNCRSIQMWGK